MGVGTLEWLEKLDPAAGSHLPQISSYMPCRICRSTLSELVAVQDLLKKRIVLV